MKKRKILFITSSLCQGGIEHFQISMLKMLDENKYDVTLFMYLNDVALLPLVPEHVKVIIDKDETHYFRQPKAISLEIKKRMCSILGFKKRAELYSKQMREYVHAQKMMHPAKDIFGEGKFDVVVANVIGRGTEMALHIEAEKRYVFFHSSLDLHHDLMERLFPQFDGIVAVSSGVQNMLHEAYPDVKERVSILENWVDAQEIIKKGNEPLIRGMSELEHNKLKIVSCGRLSKEKGFDIAVKTAEILKKKGYEYEWIFIGDGAERSKIEEMIEQGELSEEITITGFMDNPYPIIKRCDIYVQSSYEESYGRTIKEAMILRCPVVSTATVGGNLLVKDKENGILTEITPEELAEGIIEMIQNSDLQEKCREYYSLEQNEIEKQIFKSGLEKLLS